FSTPTLNLFVFPLLPGFCLGRCNPVAPFHEEHPGPYRQEDNDYSQPHRRVGDRDGFRAHGDHDHVEQRSRSRHPQHTGQQQLQYTYHSAHCGRLSTSLPIIVPDSSLRWAFSRFAAVSSPKCSVRVWRNTPVSNMREASFSSTPCWAMSGVWKRERVNMNSQLMATLLGLNRFRFTGWLDSVSTIRQMRPWGWITSA